MSVAHHIDYESMSADELYYLVGQAAGWYFKAGGDRDALDDLLDDAEEEADADEEA